MDSSDGVRELTTKYNNRRNSSVRGGHSSYQVISHFPPHKNLTALMGQNVRIVPGTH